MVKGKKGMEERNGRREGEGMGEKEKDRDGRREIAL